MTPRPLDVPVVQRKLALMDDLLRDLAALGELSTSQLAADRLRRHALERILTQLVQLAVDINAHLATSAGQPAPADYRTSFRAAAAAGVLSSDLAERLLPAVGLRNVLVHEYATVNLDLVVAARELAERDFHEYVQSVARFLDNLAQS